MDLGLASGYNTDVKDGRSASSARGNKTKMKKTFLVAAVAAAFSINGVAAAQYVPKTMDLTARGVSIRLGVGLPIDSNLRDSGASLTNVGIDWQFGRSLLPGGEGYLSVDWFAKNFRGKKGTVFPVMVNQRVYQGEDYGTRSYYFFGVGLTNLDFDGGSDSVLGLRAGIGKELGESTFFELGGSLSDKGKSGVRGNLFTLNIGYRF